MVSQELKKSLLSMVRNRHLRDEYESIIDSWGKSTGNVNTEEVVMRVAELVEPALQTAVKELAQALVEEKFAEFIQSQQRTSEIATDGEASPTTEEAAIDGDPGKDAPPTADDVV